MVDEAELAPVPVDFYSGHYEAMAVNALGSEQSICLVHEGTIVDLHGELDMAAVAGAGVDTQVAC